MRATRDPRESPEAIDAIVDEENNNDFILEGARGNMKNWMSIKIVVEEDQGSLVPTRWIRY